MRSLRSRLLVLWCFCAVGSVVGGVLLAQSAAQSTAAQVSRAEAVAARACDLIRDRYAFYISDWRGPAPPLDPRLRADLMAAVSLALLRQDGVEGGIWQAEAGPLAYAYPTYQGDAPKLDLPMAESGRIRAVNEAAIREEQPVARQWSSQSQTLLIEACPLVGPIAGLSGWAMLRVQNSAVAEGLQAGLMALLALLLAITAWLAWLLWSWSSRVNRLEATLAGASGAGSPPLASTGEPDLDRIVAALNASRRRLGEARATAEALAAQVTVAERLAALGRVAAGVAHEIRNPIAAIRLRAENALATTDEARRDRALHSVLDQVGRLDRLSIELLAMTQRREPARERCDLRAVVDDSVADLAEAAAGGGVSVRAEGGGDASVDPDLIRRALDNLLANAIRHTPRGGSVTVSAAVEGGTAVLTVADTGPGVAAALRPALFEPFASGRPDGTGLGLAIVRELVQAHGGSVSLAEGGPGARFVITLPRHEGGT